MPSHPKQSINPNKKPNSVIKLKQKNKRRCHKRKKQRLQYNLNEIREMSNANTNDTNWNYSVDNSINVTRNQMDAAQMWAKTYESMIRSQFQHRIQYWKNLAINRNNEICELKKKLQHNCNYFGEMDIIEDEADDTSSEDDLASESYLNFLEITLRHRQEIKRKNLEREDSD